MLVAFSAMQMCRREIDVASVIACLRYGPSIVPYLAPVVALMHQEGLHATVVLMCHAILCNSSSLGMTPCTIILRMCKQGKIAALEGLHQQAVEECQHLMQQQASEAGTASQAAAAAASDLHTVRQKCQQLQVSHIRKLLHLHLSLTLCCLQ